MKVKTKEDALNAFHSFMGIADDDEVDEFDRGFERGFIVRRHVISYVAVHSDSIIEIDNKWKLYVYRHDALLLVEFYIFLEEDDA